MITPFFFFENRSGSEIWDPRSFKTPFCIANYIGEAINGCSFIHQDDAFPFIQYFIEFCSSEGSEEILSIYAKNFKKKPYWKLSDAKNRMRAYQNSLMITNFISCRKTWNKRLGYYNIIVNFFFFECQKCQSNLSSQVFQRTKNWTRVTVTSFCRIPDIFISFFLQFTVWLITIPNISKALGTYGTEAIKSLLFQSIQKGNAACI